MFKKWTEYSSIHHSNAQIGFGQVVKKPDSVNALGLKPTLGLIGSDQSIDQIKSQLFNLSDQLNDCEIIDFGILKSNQIENLEPLLHQLLSDNILPIYISSNEKDGVIHMQSILNNHLLSTWMLVDAALSGSSELLEVIKTNTAEGKMKVKFLGHQAHMTSSASLEFIQKASIETMRLGHIRQNIDRVEPWCRSLDHAIFNTNALRKSDFYAKNSVNPGGLFYEEACKISQFLGASSHLQSIGFYGYNAALDPHQVSAAVIAQLIWYFIDGYIHFREDKSIQKSKLIQYTVHASHSNLDINFWKSNDSGRWWIEVPGQPDHWISCNYDDYLEASHGEFSPRLISVLNRG